MIFISIILSADNQKHEITLASQDALMRMFFEGISKEGIEKLTYHEVDREFCSGWEGIICENGEVKGVEYNRLKFGSFNVDALPPTLVYMSINHCEQNFEIQIRRFPRELTYLSLQSNNNITGRADLSELPPNLTTAFLSRNKLSGPIELTRLPRHLQCLYVNHNNICQQTVYYDNLPASIMSIHLSGNRIQEVRAVNKNMAVANKKIFRKMSPARVH